MRSSFRTLSGLSLIAVFSIVLIFVTGPAYGQIDLMR